MRWLAILLYFALAACTAPQIASLPSCSALNGAYAGSPQIERQGCCSWHGGVCGCSNGRAMCCDGKPSPSCGC